MKKSLCCLFLLCSTLVFGQGGVGSKGLNADGKDFYIGWLYPSFNSQNLTSLGGANPLPFFGVYVLISSYTDNSGTISYFDEKTGKETNTESFSIAKRRAIIKPVDRSHMKMTDPGEIPEFKSMHITAKKPINVQFFSSGACSGGSYLALPVNVLGKEYVVESYNDDPGFGGYLSHDHTSGYFMVIASFDGTTVTITPNTTTAAGKPGVSTGDGSNGTPKPFSISLQRGQCYMVKSSGELMSYDISGSTVVSNKPISVIAGHENANIAGSDLGTYDHLDARDFMVEQLVPVEYWSTTGYIGMPFVDGANAQGGEGDEYRVYYGKLNNAPASYPTQTAIKMQPNNNITITAKQFPLPVASQQSVTTPVSFSSLDSVKFQVVQYDQRMHGGSTLSPTPSQMSIIPLSAWKTSYLWYVPSNVTPQEVFQGYYINLICDKSDYNNGTLQWALDGGNLLPIKTAGTLNGSKQIPGYPNLIGMTIKLAAPKAYYATSLTKTPFMVYSYGFRAIAADRNLGGNNDEKDFYFSYALPVGFAANTGDSSYFKVILDTLCHQWNLCTSVTGTNSPKIKSFTMLNDPAEDLIDKPNSSTGYDSYNVRFDPAEDPNNTKEVVFNGTDSSKCIKIFVQNPLDSAYAAVLVTDDKGNYIVAELYYKASALADTILALDYDLSKAPWDRIGTRTLGYHKDSIMYPITGIDDNHCATIYYYNTGDSTKGTPPIIVTGTKLGGADGSFAMTTQPLVPITLRPKSASHSADTLKVTVCFNSKDTLFHIDTMTLQTECFDAPVDLFGPGGMPLITATDYDFGPVVVGSTNCSGNSTYGPPRITVRNLGNLPFVLTNQWTKDNFGAEFSMSPASAARLPYTLSVAGDPQRRDSINLYFCYSPVNLGIDSTIIKWNTDIKLPFANDVKSWTYLKGRGIKPGILWEEKNKVFIADSTKGDTSIIQRVHLFSNASAVTRVEKVSFFGPDAAEFAVVGNQLGQNPLEGFDMNVGDTIWVDIIFTPDISKPYPFKFADRPVELEAVFFTNASQTNRDTVKIDVTGTFNLRFGAVKEEISIEHQLKAYIYGRQLIIELPEGDEKSYDCSLYDLLGRKIIDWPKQSISPMSLMGNNLILPIPKLTAGAYLLRLRSHFGEQGCLVVVTK